MMLGIWWHEVKRAPWRSTTRPPLPPGTMPLAPPSSSDGIMKPAISTQIEKTHENASRPSIVCFTFDTPLDSVLGGKPGSNRGLDGRYLQRLVYRIVGIGKRMGTSRGQLPPFQDPSWVHLSFFPFFCFLVSSLAQRAVFVVERKTAALRACVFESSNRVFH